MCFLKKYIFIFFITSQCYALTCRSENGKQEETVRKAFNNCKRQINNNNSDSTEDSRNYNRRNQWQYDNRNDNTGRNTWVNKNGGSDNRQRNEDVASERYDKMVNRHGGQNTANGKNDRWDTTNRNEGSNTNGYNYGSNRNINNNNRNDQINGKVDFFDREEFNGGDTAYNWPRQRNYFYVPPQSSNRYKREKRVEVNSGQRSQYNPHSQKSSSNENNNDRNSSTNSSKEVERGCVLQCLFETLRVTDDNGMPDRYLVTHFFAKDKQNEDVRDYVQETIEECYQLVEHENTDDKCEVSKNLITCFVEKERGNCDDYGNMNSYLLE